MPNKILVLDKSAKKIAFDEGIQNSQIDILNNPYHQYLKQWKPGNSVNNFFSKNKISKKKIITIGLDPLSNAGGIKKFGSDETIILNKILMSLKRFELDDTIIIIKSHPNQNINLLQDIIDNFKLDVLLIEKIDTKILIFLSEIVIGIFLKFLVGAKNYEKYA